jgi:hypothetical protein
MVAQRSTKNACTSVCSSRPPSKQGVAVAVNARQSVTEGQAVVDEINRQGGAAILCTGDVTDRTGVEGMVWAIEEAWGRLYAASNREFIRDAGSPCNAQDSAWSQRHPDRGS